MCWSTIPKYSCGHTGAPSPTKAVHICNSKHHGFPCTPAEKKPSFLTFYCVCKGCSDAGPPAGSDAISANPAKVQNAMEGGLPGRLRDLRFPSFNKSSFAGIKYSEHSKSSLFENLMDNMESSGLDAEEEGSVVMDVKVEIESPTTVQKSSPLTAATTSETVITMDRKVDAVFHPYYYAELKPDLSRAKCRPKLSPTFSSYSFSSTKKTSSVTSQDSASITTTTIMRKVSGLVEHQIKKELS